MKAQIDDVEMILTEARGLVEKGWIRNSYHRTSPDGQELFCAVGAMGHAMRESMKGKRGAADAFHEAMKAFRATIEEKSITSWNDRVAKNKDEVLEKFTQAIRSLWARKEMK